MFRIVAIPFPHLPVCQTLKVICLDNVLQVGRKIVNRFIQGGIFVKPLNILKYRRRVVIRNNIPNGERLTVLILPDGL